MNIFNYVRKITTGSAAFEHPRTRSFTLTDKIHTRIIKRTTKPPHFAKYYADEANSHDLRRIIQCNVTAACECGTINDTKVISSMVPKRIIIK